jgi:putative membrane protein
MDEPDPRIDLAENRTELAEDRTILANERTFAGWARTALAAIGIGLAFNALFKAMEPTWVAKAIASVFIVLGVFLTWMAERRAHAVAARLESHSVKSMNQMNLRLIAAAVSLGSTALIAGIWLLV